MKLTPLKVLGIRLGLLNVFHNAVRKFSIQFSIIAHHASNGKAPEIYNFGPYERSSKSDRVHYIESIKITI